MKLIRKYLHAIVILIVFEAVAVTLWLTILNMHINHGIHITLPDRKVQMKKAIEHLLESPKFGLTWDVGHSKAIGEKDVPFLMEQQKNLIHFHIHDGSDNPPRNHFALGDGKINLAERLKLAENRNGRCVLETKTIAALKQSVMWLHEYWE